MRRFSAGDHVVYRKQKHSAHPGSRAQEIQPAQHGETYSYMVDKYWTVARAIDDETIEVLTRRGKVHRLSVNDPLLRKASLLEKVFKRRRFPDLAEARSAA